MSWHPSSTIWWARRAKEAISLMASFSLRAVFWVCASLSPAHGFGAGGATSTPLRHAAAAAHDSARSGGVSAFFFGGMSNIHSCSQQRSIAPRASHLGLMSKRSRRRKRGEAIGERHREMDMEYFQAIGGVPPAGVLGPATPPRQPFPYVCVVDVEATCEEHSKHYVHEIIEFPVVVFDTAPGGGVVGEFHTYVRPTINSTLTPFCTKLTGITQEQVDAAPTLAETLVQFDEWLTAQGFVHSDERKDFAFAADGPWDLRFFIHGECLRKGIDKPGYFDKWCNMKSLFADFYKVRACKIHKMLSYQNMKFEGRLHSGIDDTRNIARICMRLRDDGAVLYNNEALPPSHRAGGILAEKAQPSSFSDALKLVKEERRAEARR